MIFLFIIAIVVISSVVRLIELPFRLTRWGRGNYYGGGYPGCYGYGCGYRRHRGAGRLIVALLVLFFLSHFFGHHHHHSF